MSDPERHQPGVLRVLQTRAETKAFYNKIAKVYDLLAERSEQPMRSLGLEKLDIREGEQVLELGFGTGTCLIELASRVGCHGKVFGVDIANEMLEVAERKVADEDLQNRVELVCSDAMTLPYLAGSMDAVFMSFTLELFDTPEIPLVLAECKRVLRPGGRIAVVGVLVEWVHYIVPALWSRSAEKTGRLVKSAARGLA